MRRVGLLAVCSVGLACALPATTLGLPCEEDSHCDSGQFCSNGICRQDHGWGGDVGTEDGGTDDGGADDGGTDDGGMDPPGDDGGGGGFYGPCGEFDQSEVYFHGSLRPKGAGEVGERTRYDAFVRLESTDPPCVGFDGSAPPMQSMISHDGRHFSRRDGTGLWEMAPDEITWDSQGSRWEYPEDPEANDTAIDAPCGESGGSVSAFSLHPGTGELFYCCVEAGGRCWHREDGSEIEPLCGSSSSPYTYFPERITVLYDGTIAFARGSDGGSVSLVDTTEEDRIDVMPPEMRSGDTLYDIRATSEGAWIAIARDGGTDRWKLTGTTLVDEGVYAEEPEQVQPQDWRRVLDAEGRLYVIAKDFADPPSDYVIYRTSLLTEGGESVVVWQDTYDDLWLEPDVPPVSIYDFCHLFTGVGT